MLEARRDPIEDRIAAALINGGWGTVIQQWFVRSTLQTAWSQEELDRIVGSYLACMARDVRTALIDGSA